MSKALKAAALDKAIALLAVANVSYYITDATGKVHASDDYDLSEASEKPKRRNDFSHIGYYTTIKGLDVGGVARFYRAEWPVLGPNTKWNSFKASVTSVCRQRFGIEGYVCHVAADQSYIEVMRAA